jgi:hypothetical protein
VLGFAALVLSTIALLVDWYAIALLALVISAVGFGIGVGRSTP